MDIIIHIGTAKTGSTAIQHFFSGNRTALRDYGILYPETLGAVNHVTTPVYAGAPAAFAERHFPELRGAPDHEGFRRRAETALAAEIAAARPRRVVVSNEHLSEHVRDAEAARRIARLFGGGAARLRVVLYLRRQDRLAVSLYAETIRMGSCVHFKDFLQLARTRRILDFLGAVGPWLDAFGPDVVAARVFEADRLPEGGVVPDFLDLVAPEAAPEILTRLPAAGRRVRRALDREALALLLRLNTVCRDLAAAETEGWPPPPRYLDPALRKPLWDALEGPRHSDAGPLECGRREAKRILRAYAADNAALFARLGVASFDDRFSRRRAPVDAQMAALARDSDRLLRRALPLMPAFDVSARPDG